MSKVSFQMAFEGDKSRRKELWRQSDDNQNSEEPNYHKLVTKTTFAWYK